MTGTILRLRGSHTFWCRKVRSACIVNKKRDKEKTHPSKVGLVGSRNSFASGAQLPYDLSNQRQEEQQQRNLFCISVLVQELKSCLDADCWNVIKIIAPA